MKLATPTGALSGNSVQVILPTAVLMTATGCVLEPAVCVPAAVAPRFGGVVCAGLACAQPIMESMALHRSRPRNLLMQSSLEIEYAFNTAADVGAGARLAMAPPSVL